MIANTLADILASLKKQKISGFLKIAFGFSVFFRGFFLCSLLASQVKFEYPQINENDKIIFIVEHSSAFSPSYKTLFLADAANVKDSKILTCFPEKMQILTEVNGGKSKEYLEIRNRYGTARFTTSDMNLVWYSKVPEIPAESTRLVPEISSPDGRWLCYVKRTGATVGQLVIRNNSDLKEYVLDENAAFSFTKVPVKWSPDGAVLIYEKNGNIYFIDPKMAFQKYQIDDAFRKIGEGSINSVNWANRKTLIYINRDLVYKLNANELFTRSLYAGMAGSGIVAGRIPVSFDAKNDEFWVNSAETALAVKNANCIITCFKMNTDGGEYISSTYSKPFTDPRGSVVNYYVFWGESETPILWVNLIGLLDGKPKTSVFKIDSQMKQIATFDEAGIPIPSPDGKKLAFALNDALFVYDIDTWKPLGKISGEKPVSYAWSGNYSIFAGGESTVRHWKLNGGEDKKGLVRTLFLSSVRSAVWNDSEILVRDACRDDVFYSYDSKNHYWKKSIEEFDEEILKSSKYLQNGKYRVFTDATENKKFENTIYVRALNAAGSTKPIFLSTTKKTPAPKKISLIFDAVDSVDGLSTILYVLSRYGIKSTFFFNGEFIRRYPLETKQIIYCGHEAASMFFNNVDLTAKNGFVVDSEYIQRGLARNEDEFFNLTGTELSLFWHAPGYKSSEMIKKSGDDCGYTYVEAGRFSLDTKTLEQGSANKSWYMTADQLVMFYAQNVKNGSVIPISVGNPNGTRGDYLYEKLDLLIGILMDAGSEFVPVRKLF